MPAVLDRPIVEALAKSDLAIGLEKLADLLERGAQMKPQARGLYFEYAHDGIRTCAIGAMIDAMGKGVDVFSGCHSAMPFDYCGVDPYMRVPHPAMGHNATIEHVTMDLNDNRFWSREQIAAWYRQLAIDLS